MPSNSDIDDHHRKRVRSRSAALERRLVALLGLGAQVDRSVAHRAPFKAQIT
jgi:hypothetical protein